MTHEFATLLAEVTAKTSKSLEFLHQAELAEAVENARIPLTAKQADQRHLGRLFLPITHT